MELTIPTPCTENWESMQPHEQGRFCSSCQKAVIDFTNYSDQQLIEYFSRHSGITCGKLYTSQLQKLAPQQITKRIRNSWPVYFLSFGLSIVSYAPLQAQSLKIAAPMQISLSPISLARTPLTDCIEGSVIDPEDNPIPGAFVRVQGMPIGSLTNDEGKFKLILPDSLQDKHIRLEIGAVGYYTTMVSLPLTAATRNIKLQQEAIARLGRVFVCGGVVAKSSLWQRVKNFFR